MHHRILGSKKPLLLLGLFFVACGGRYVDPSGSPETGGNAGSGSPTGGTATGGSGGGQAGGSSGSDTGGRDPGTNPGTSGSGGSPGGSGGSTGGAGPTTGGSGGSTAGTGGSIGGTGGTGGSTGGAGGSTGGAGGSTGGMGGSTGNPCSTGGSGGVLEGQMGRPAAATTSGSGGTGDGAGLRESGAPTIDVVSTPIVDVVPTPCFCTRRPGPGVSLRCPAGIDESTAAIIGPTGGSVTLTGRQGIASGAACQLTVPPKALDREITVTITETSIPPPKEFTDWSPIYEVLPGCIKSSSIMKLRLPWGNRDGVVSSGLTIYHAKDRNSPFTALPDVYINAGFSDAGITEFGLFFVGALKSPDQAGCP